MYEKASYKDTLIEINCNALRLITGLSHFKFRRAELRGDRVIAEIESARDYAVCPCCGKKSRSVHSHYIRHIRDLPLYGRSLEMVFRARRFRCRNSRCRQTVFTEQPPELAVRYGRRSTQERGMLLKMAVEESAMAASRIATLVGMPVSPSTVLRMVKGTWMDPDRASVTNIGIDDFALRKGMSYGTIVTDNDTGKPLEIILSRDADKVTECLKKYVNVKTVTRDRAGEYAKAVTDGIPTAIQIAERFHLVMNCGDNIKKQMRKSLKDIEEAEHKDIQKPMIQANAVNPTKLYIYTCNPEYGVNKKTGECSKENIMYNDLIRRSAILSGLREVIQSFREVMKGKSTDSLDKWIAKFSKSSFHHISTFATFLLKDIDAVKNAIRYPYSNGLTEGINNKIKAIKRQMYGRAKTSLLATRLVASMAT